MEKDSHKSTLHHVTRPDEESCDVISRRAFLSVLISGSLLAARALAQAPTDQRERFRRMPEEGERRGLAEPFRGITPNGKVTEGLFPIKSTGVSTAPVRNAAEAFLASLTREQRVKTMFPIDDPEWRKWMNQHFYVRQGISFKEMTEAQREAAFRLMRASLSAKGMQLTRNIMRLNENPGGANRGSCISRRVAVFHHHHGQTFRYRAVGLAARWSSRHHQLFRPGRPGGYDASLRRIGAGDC